MKQPHHILSAILVIIAGTIAGWLAQSAAWIRRYDKTRSNE